MDMEGTEFTHAAKNNDRCPVKAIFYEDSGEHLVLDLLIATPETKKR